MTVLTENQVVPIQRIAAPMIPQKLGASLSDATSACRVEHGSAEYLVAIEQIAEILLDKLQ